MYKDDKRRIIATITLAENAGFGIDKLRSWKQLTGQEVFIRNERDYVLIVLELQRNVVERRGNVVDNVVERKQESVGKLPNRLQAIVNLIKEDRTLSATQIATKLSIASRIIQRDLTKLKQMGIITHVGPDRGGYWKIQTENT